MTALISVLLILVLLPIVLLRLQGQRVRRRVPRLSEAPGRRSGQVDGKDPVLRLLILGESPAVGVGLDHIDETVSVQTARQLAELSGRAVNWTVMGYSGARLRDLHRVYSGNGAGHGYDLALLISGVNDTTSLHSRAGFRTDMSKLIARMRDGNPGLAIVMAGIPPLDAFPALPRALAFVLGWHARRLDGVMPELAQCDRRLGHVPCGPVAVGEFAADGFHPDAAASQRWAQGLADACHEILRNADASSGHRDRDGGNSSDH